MARNGEGSGSFDADVTSPKTSEQRKPRAELVTTAKGQQSNIPPLAPFRFFFVKFPYSPKPSYWVIYNTPAKVSDPIPVARESCK